MSTETGERTARWDGKDLAAVQIATWPLPRRSGRPGAEVTADWDLTINDRFVPVGSFITVTQDGTGVTVTYGSPVETGEPS